MALEEDLLLDPRKAPVRVLLLGSSGSGKSYLLKYLMLYLYDLSMDGKDRKPMFDYGILYCPTAGLSRDYDYIPAKAKVRSFSIQKLSNYHEHLKKKCEDERAKNPDYKPPPNFIIFDDLLGALGKDTNVFKNFVVTARHTNTSLFFTAQLLSQGSSTVLREQITHFFSFYTNQMSNVKNIYENFGGYFSSLQKFRAHFKNVCVGPELKYACMVYINNNQLEVEFDEETNRNNYMRIVAPSSLSPVKSILPN